MYLYIIVKAQLCIFLSLQMVHFLSFLIFYSTFKIVAATVVVCNFGLSSS